MGIVIQELVRGAFTLVAAGVGVFVGALLGSRAYFRQKEYELVKERYLEGAIDVVASEIDQTFEIFRQNWARCLNIMKAFRDEKEAFDLKELSIGFRDMKLALHQLAHHRIGDLVGSQVIWGVYQLAIAHVVTADAVITKEFPEVIRLKLEKGMVPAEPIEIFDTAYQELGKLDEESNRFAHLTRALHRLGQMLEQERLTFKMVATFKDRPEVKTLVADLEREFKSDLKGDGESILTPASNSHQGKATRESSIQLAISCRRPPTRPRRTAPDARRPPITPLRRLHRPEQRQRDVATLALRAPGLAGDQLGAPAHQFKPC